VDWRTLLNPSRTRQLEGGKPSRTADFRDQFRRDYGRIVFSTPFRRLQDKAQVFPLEAHDSVRTRLTHTHEVASISQDIAQRVTHLLMEHQKYHDHLSFDESKAIESVACSCALLHDMGNPPFGHAGEESISEWFTTHSQDFDFWKGIEGRGEHDPLSTNQLRNDFLKFEGNAQTIRIVTRLQLLNDPHGLNLTAGTVSAALKYVGGSHQIDKTRHQFSKHGYFASEAPLVEKIRNATGTGTNESPLRNPIALMVEAADDLAYSTVDIEDAVRKRVVNWEQVRNGVIAEASQFDAEQKPAESAENLAQELLDKAEELIDRDCEFNLSPWEKAEAYSIMFRTLLIGSGTTQVVQSFIANYERIMESGIDSSLLSLGVTGAVVGACKTFAAKDIYPKTSGLELLGRNVIHDLMNFFWHEVKDCPDTIDDIKPSSFRAKAIKMTSTNYRRIYELVRRDGKIPPRYLEFQFITDYICGMTDSFACSLHRSIFNG
jgi:dGTPase